MGSSLTGSDNEKARDCLDESLKILKDQSSGILADVLQNIGELNRQDGRHIEAYSQFCHSLDLKVADADRYGSAASVLACGLIAVSSEQLKTAAALLGKAASIRDKLGVPPPPNLAEELETACEALTAGLATEARSRIKTKSDSMSVAAALQAARSIEDSIVDPVKEEPEDEVESNEDDEIVTESDTEAALDDIEKIEHVASSESLKLLVETSESIAGRSP